MRLWNGHRWFEYDHDRIVIVMRPIGEPTPVVVTQHDDCPSCDALAGVECEVNPAFGTLYEICQSRMNSWTDLGYDEEDLAQGLPGEEVER